MGGKCKFRRCTVEGCEATFNKKMNFDAHLRKHKGERPFVCEKPDCDKTYTNESHLRRHVKVAHVEEKKDERLMCDFEGCGQAYANKYSLKKHWKAAHDLDKYPFKCSQCSQGFHKKRQLQQHSYVHTGVAPFQCDDCLQGFTTILLFNKHKRNHKSYTCECGEVFVKWSMRLLHKKTCKTPKLFKCHLCSKSFDQSTNLKSHLAVHADQSKRVLFACTYEDCKNVYFHKKNLTWHINTFHEKVNANIKLPCTYHGCAVTFKSKRSLRSHVSKQHAGWTESNETKKERRARFDKGKPTKCMASLLSGVEIPLDANKKLIEAKPTKSTASLPSGVEVPLDVGTELIETNPTKSMASLLSGVEAPLDVNTKLIETRPAVLSEPELTLSELYKQINTNKTIAGQS